MGESYAESIKSYKLVTRKYQYGATMPFSDMGIDYRGTFVYNDGRTLKLNNGKGGDEMIATYNFVESHQ
jgi:hypothetical protein